MQEFVLPLSNEIGTTGIFHLKRLWSKALQGLASHEQYAHEWIMDNAVMDILGLGLLPTFRYLYEQRPSFEDFEEWVAIRSNINMHPQLIEQCNALFNVTVQAQQDIYVDTLSATDMAFWNEHGYVIIKQAVSEEDCAAARAAIMDHLQMDEDDPGNWYQQNNNIEGIMVPLYRHPAIDRNRNSLKIRRAFEQLWNRTDLAVTIDKCGFNPPETEDFKYRGIGLHWDVSLATPIPFGTQGILYLTDTAGNQGALTVVDGFHNKLEDWLHSLPTGTNPRNIDLSNWEKKAIAANAGDFIIWDHRLPHGASPNTATTPRLVQYIQWYYPLQQLQKEWI